MTPKTVTKRYVDLLAFKVIGCAIEVHKQLGPGLLESVYKKCLAYELEKGGLHVVKLISAAVLVAGYGILMKGNHLGAILALPILFAAFLQDFGFYAMAPLFILTVMFLMGERRLKHMGIIMLGIYAIIIFMFVSVLYVGLPTGTISPFYEFGTQLVNIFQ